jgi:TonB-dependent SusC/RagA subfamily outer membrane receptor
MSSFSSRRLFCSALALGFASACSSGGGSRHNEPAPEVGKAGQSVTAKDVSNTPSGSVEKTLEGRFPGVVVLRTSSGGLSIRIRGAASVNAQGTNAPLYVIDGTPVEAGPDGDLPGLNPYDIESIKVLKDAASTTMYGSRGGHGVIIIKTKH